jgi:hypothetical protein
MLVWQKVVSFDRDFTWFTVKSKKGRKYTISFFVYPELYQKLEKFVAGLKGVKKAYEIRLDEQTEYELWINVDFKERVITGVFIKGPGWNNEMNSSSKIIGERAIA